MVRSSMTLLAVALLAAVASATVVGSVTFNAEDDDTSSSHWQGDPRNDTVTFYAEASFMLGGISWDGIAEPREDVSPGLLGPYPTAGKDLHARITHVSSGTFTDMQLGNGYTFAPSRQFTGDHLGLITTQVQAGDAFTIEFFESFDNGESSADHSPDPDAIWNEIAFSFDDAIPSDFAAVAHGNTTGAQTWDRPDNLSGDVSSHGRDMPYHWYELSVDMTGDYDFEIICAGLDFENASTNNYDFDTYLHLFDSDGFDPNDASYAGLIALDNDGGEGRLSRISIANGDAATLTAGDTYHLIVSGKLNDQDGVDAGAYTLFVAGPDGASLTLDPREYVDADFNEDETVDRTDFELWSAGFGMTELAEHGNGDADMDGDVDGADFLIWQRQFAFSPIADADFNDDELVDGADFALWSDGFGETELAEHGNGDADMDGDVDGADFLIWQRQYDGSSPEGNAVGVPEPTAIALTALALAGLAWFRCQ